MSFDISKFIGRFLEEGREHVNALNKGLMELQRNPGDKETVNAVFRSAHTIKGSSRMLKLIAISELAHRLEDALGALRDGRIGMSEDLSAILFRAIDAVSAMMDRIEAGEEIKEADEALCALLRQAASGGLPKSAGAARMIEESASSKPETTDGRKPKQRLAADETIRINIGRLNDLVRLASEISSAHSRSKQRQAEISGLQKLSVGALRMIGDGDAEAASDIIGRISRSLAKQAVSFRNDLAVEDLLMRELQERTLGMRMLPLSTLFDTFHRTVREIAQSMGKDVGLAIEGGETELDKKIIEKLGDPLVHMFRNSLDHGIESPEERASAGKPLKATISLTAGYEAGNVVVVLSDDGRGINLRAVRERALQRGIVDREKISLMSEAEVLSLIFLPGFSTARLITDVSGRGVGMDVVRKNIVDGLKGSIDIKTEDGKGTSFIIRLPMTLAIMRVLLVEAGGMAFAFPQNYISEIRKIKESDVITVLEKKAVNIREQLVPVEDLGGLLGIPGNGAAKRPDEFLLMIIKVGGERMSVAIDSILEEEDMVIKPLPEHLKSVEAVSGVIITGKDRIVNVINVPSLLAAAREARYSVRRREERQIEEGAHILVVDDSINTREIEKNILEAYGYRVTLAGDGEEAFSKTRKHQYDLVITDVEMPKMDGFTLTEMLRSDEKYRETPIILLTSRDKEEDKRRGIQVGANAYILKGAFDQTNLLDTVRDLL